MTQRREHRLRSLEKQQQELSGEIIYMKSVIRDMNREIYELNVRIYGNNLLPTKLPWYKRLFGRKRR